MEAAFIIAVILLVAFAILAVFDGFYLHLVRYKLFLHPESRNEHVSHTARAVLFPLILYFLYLGDSATYFYVGLALVVIDVLVLGIDAYMEKDSRKFMGGLPRGEYIIHLMVNGFHFASIAVFIVIRVRLKPHGLELASDFKGVSEHNIFNELVKQLIPGGIVMAAMHTVLLLEKPVRWYEKMSRKFNCCMLKHGSL